jgi:hypothetical protein
VRWPRESEGFAALTASTDDCGVEAEPVCAYESRDTFANDCRAQLAGLAADELLPGPCAALRWETCSAFDSQTCVWDKKAYEQSSLVAPLVRY